MCKRLVLITNTTNRHLNEISRSLYCGIADYLIPLQVANNF